MLEALINLKDTNQLTINRKTCKKSRCFFPSVCDFYQVCFSFSNFIIGSLLIWCQVPSFHIQQGFYQIPNLINACSIYDFTKTHFFVRYLNVKWIFASIIFIRIYINKHVKVCHCALPCPSPYILRQLLDKLEIVLLKKI